MKRHICISTGCFHDPRISDDTHQKIYRAMQLENLDGVEILFPEAGELVDFKFKKEEIDFLKGLDHNTIHAPFFINPHRKLADYRNIPLYRKMMKRIYEIYGQIDAQNITMHPEEISDYSLFKMKDYQHSIENSPPKSNYSIQTYRDLINRHPDLRFVLDVSRALEGGELNRLIKALDKDIICCHTAMYDKQTPNLFLHNLEKKKLRRLEPVKRLNCSFISETSTYVKDIDFYQKEIDFIRRWLNE